MKDQLPLCHDAFSVVERFSFFLNLDPFDRVSNGFVIQIEQSGKLIIFPQISDRHMRYYPNVFVFGSNAMHMRDMRGPRYYQNAFSFGSNAMTMGNECT